MTTEDPTPLIASTARPALERALREKIAARPATHGSMGELEPLAVRLGLIQSTLRPRLKQPQLLVFAGDHGLSTDITHPGDPGTEELVEDVLRARVPLSVLAHMNGVHFHLVDCGLATHLPAQPGVMARKIAHGTRNCRVAPAMSMEQVHSAIRAGMEIAQDLPGNALGCAGIGIGSHEAAALVISRLSGRPHQDLMFGGPQTDAITLEQRLTVLRAAEARHLQIDDPVEVLAAFGGFETAVMVGAMLVAASQRRLILIDGIAACAALMVASRIGGPVSDYCVFCRSSSHAGLDAALAAFNTSALLEIGLQSVDGTGVALTWPILQAAATLMSRVCDTGSSASQADGQDARLTRDAARASGEAAPDASRWIDTSDERGAASLGGDPWTRQSALPVPHHAAAAG